MDVVALANFFAEKELEPGPIEAWRADHCLAAALGVPVGTVVWLSYYNFLKTCLAHRDVTFAEFEKLPVILSRGFVFRGRKRTAEICHWIDGRPIKIVLKATSKNEVYLKTFHRVHWKEARRLFRRAKDEQSLCREPETELAQQLMSRQ